MDARRWLRRAVMLGLLGGTVAWVRVAGFRLNRKRAEEALRPVEAPGSR